MTRVGPRLLARICALGLAGVLAGVTPQAAAAPRPRPRVAVLPTMVTGELEEHWRGKLADRLLAGLVRGEFEVADIASPDTAGCVDVECRRNLASDAGAEYVVTSGIVAAPRQYRVALELVDGATGSVLATATRECDVCTVEEVGELLAEATGELRARLDGLVAGPPSLVIDSRPRGAKVTIDGTAAGVTPLEEVVSAGSHEATITHPGYVDQRLTLRAVPGLREQIAVELQPLPRPTAPPRRARDLRPWGWTALAVGVAGLAAGAALLAVDGNEDRSACSGNDVDADGDCRYRYDSLPGGAGLTAVGGAAAVAGVVMLVVHARRVARLRRAQRTAVAWGR
jgi:TolB-like protein